MQGTYSHCFQKDGLEKCKKTKSREITDKCMDGNSLFFFSLLFVFLLVCLFTYFTLSSSDSKKVYFISCFPNTLVHDIK